MTWKAGINEPQIDQCDRFNMVCSFMASVPRPLSHQGAKSIIFYMEGLGLYVAFNSFGHIATR